MRALLFSGHMVDRPDRAVPRLPAARVPAARRAIEAELDALAVGSAGAAERAVTSAACGGDLLFAQACLARAIPLEIYLPYARERFLQTSVLPGGAQWRVIFDAVLADVRTELHVMSGDPDADEDPYARCNLAMLHQAQALAGTDVDLVCLWDGAAGDGPGGTEHMVSAVRALGGRVHWIDTRGLVDSADSDQRHAQPR